MLSVLCHVSTEREQKMGEEGLISGLVFSSLSKPAKPAPWEAVKTGPVARIRVDEQVHKGTTTNIINHSLTKTKEECGRGVGVKRNGGNERLTHCTK